MPKLNQDQMNNLNRPTTPKEIEAAIKRLTTIKFPVPNGFSAEYYQNVKEELIPILLKLFPTIKTEGTFPNSFYKAIVTLILRPQKDSTKKELQTNLPHEH